MTNYKRPTDLDEFKKEIRFYYDQLTPENKYLFMLKVEELRREQERSGEVATNG